MSNETPQQPTPANELLEALGTTLSPDLLVQALTHRSFSHEHPGVANPSTYSSIREMADMVYREFGTGDARVIIDVDPNAPYPPEHHLPLDVSRLEALGWRPQVGLEDMYRKLIAYMG